MKRTPNLQDIAAAIGILMLFLVMQFVCTLVVTTSQMWSMLLASSLGALFTALIMAWRFNIPRPSALREHTRPAMTGKDLLYAFAGSIFAIGSTSILNELLLLSDKVTPIIVQASHHPISWISVGILAPIGEELVFRNGIQGHLTRKGVHPLWAIVLSSVMFSLAHFNPAQSLNAMFMGFVLGILYHRTGNILLCGTLHVINNLLAMIQLAYFPGSMSSTLLLDNIHSRPMAWTIMTATALPAIILLRKTYLGSEKK